MSIIVSGISPRTITTGSPASPNTPHVGGPVPAPAANLEISSAARLAYVAQQGQPITQKIQPLNIIWGNSPK